MFDKPKIKSDTINLKEIIKNQFTFLENSSFEVDYNINEVSEIYKNLYFEFFD